MTRLQEIITLIVGCLTVVGVVGGFGVGLMRRWWALEQWIKISIEKDKKFKKRDQKLKVELRTLVEQKLSDHSAFDTRLANIERTLDALQSGTTRRKLHRRQ